MRWDRLELLGVLVAVLATVFLPKAVPQSATAPGTALEQGWSADDVERWYSAYQGSRLLPLAWFEALEQPDGEALFLDDAFIAHFGYLPRRGQLPVGFAVDRQDARNLRNTNLTWKPGQSSTTPWVGMTCAACHTGEIRYGDKAIRVEGGATLADFQGFLEALNRALQQTHDDPAKFARFAGRVLGPTPTAGGADALRQALAQRIAYQQKLANMAVTSMRYGPGRLDAVGYIYNKVAFIADPNAPGANPPDAPVSYPFLWNTSQQTHVQWNGIAANTPMRMPSGQTLDLGALGRNFGEVTGVFGDVSVAAGTSGPQYSSSIEVNNLIALEQQLMRLKPPRWPRDLFPVDGRLAAEGKSLFQARCAACHTELRRDDLTTRSRSAPGGQSQPLEVMAYFQPQQAGEAKVDTDPWMACNAAMDQTSAGVLAGAPTGVTGQSHLPDPAPGSLLLRAVIVGVMHADQPQLALAGIESFTGTNPPPQFNRLRLGGPARMALAVRTPQQLRAARLARCNQYAASANYKDLAYKARPLTGVWATAPFLHNGSVPTLYDLLLPAAQRPSRFNLGSLQFDPKRVGFATAPSPQNRYVFQARDANGAVIDGNSNQGHDYGNASLSERQRLALVEYLKVIGE